MKLEMALSLFRSLTKRLDSNRVTEGITICKLPGESPFCVELYASNGSVASTIEITTPPEALKIFAHALNTFPHFENDDACLEVGSESGRGIPHVYLRAYPFGVPGSAALEVLTDNRKGPPDHGRVHFSIRTGVADLNRLGAELLQWLDHHKKPLKWVP